MEGSVRTQPPGEQSPNLVEVPRRPRRRRGSPDTGPRPLVAMALAAIAQNHAALGPKHIAGLSDRQRDALRRALKSSRDLSLRLWKLFLPPESTNAFTDRSNLPGIPDSELAAEPRPVHLYCTQSRKPNSPLNTYIAALSAPSLEFIAHLRITARFHADFGVSELMKLATMPNLGVLEIMEIASDPAAYGRSTDRPLDSNQVSDRLIRGWSLTRPNPFLALRVLRFWGCCGDTLTKACLQYAAELPLLAHFDVSVESNSHLRTPGAWSEVGRTASTFGWTGFSLQKQDFRYSLPQADTSKSSSSTILTLNMVEDKSMPVEALHWGSRLYSFLAGAGYDARKTSKELLTDVTTAGRVVRGTPSSDFALMSLGSDQAVRRQSFDRQEDHTFCFIRTQEALTARAVKGKKAVETADHVAPQRASAGRRNSGEPPSKRRKAGRSIGNMLGDFAA